jgi:tRNA(Ile)-lysidine synthase
MHSFKSIHNSIQELIAKHSLKKVLVGLSGGPDSRALLSALKNVEIGIAHVDHRWREESEKEAEELRVYAEALNIPFHLKVLNPSEFKGNLEELCRTERLRFFS